MNKKKKIFLIVGARPNFIKAAPLYFELKKNEKFLVTLVHTGQHKDPFMSGGIFTDLGLPKPDVSLEVGAGSHKGKFARILDVIRLKKIMDGFFKDQKPDLVVVFGDVFSTLVAAFSAKKHDIFLAHVEAGLRSGDLSMPEEVNRILVDRISDFLFTPSLDANENLKKAGISSKKIHFVGNIMIDTLAKNLKRAKELKSFKEYGLSPKKYIYLTLHRQSNVDRKKTLSEILEAIREISGKTKVIFPIHPRTKSKLEKYELLTGLSTEKNIILCDPVGYLENVNLQANAAAVFTDSGGIQEETSFLGVPCFTLRKNTERPVTIFEGTNVLVGTKKHQIISAWRNHEKLKAKPKIKYWDGKTAERIGVILEEIIDKMIKT